MINSVMNTVSNILGSPQVPRPVQNRRSNSTRFVENEENSPNLSTNFSTFISPVKTSRENSMSMDSYESSSIHSDRISIDLKHNIDTINLDNPVNMKVAVQYLLEKVRDNESLLIAVSKENRSMSDDISELYTLNDALVAENTTLRDELSKLDQKQERCMAMKNVEPAGIINEEYNEFQKKTLNFVSHVCTWKKDIESTLDSMRVAFASDLDVRENSLMEEIVNIRDEIDGVKMSCKAEKDEICEAMLHDFQRIELDLKALETTINDGFDNRCHMNQCSNLRKEVQEVQDQAVHHQILLEAIKEEHSDSIDRLQENVIRLERDITVTNQYNRRPNLVIDGIPDSVPQWKLESTCLDLIHKLGFKNVGVYEVVGCHRLKKGVNDITTPTIIRFINRKIPEFCKKNRWRLKKIRFNNWNLSMRDDLCESNDEILRECERLRDEGIFSKVYTYNGFVKVTRPGSNRPRKLTHMSDLENLTSYNGYNVND